MTEYGSIHSSKISTFSFTQLFCRWFYLAINKKQTAPFLPELGKLYKQTCNFILIFRVTCVENNLADHLLVFSLVYKKHPSHALFTMSHLLLSFIICDKDGSLFYFETGHSYQEHDRLKHHRDSG
jgi:hypothetical protein